MHMDASVTQVQTATPAFEYSISESRNGGRASQRGATETFTGAVRIDPLFDRALADAEL